MRVRRDYQVRCPECRSGVGQPCRGKQNERLLGVHFQRSVALRRETLSALCDLYRPLAQPGPTSSGGVR